MNFRHWVYTKRVVFCCFLFSRGMSRAYYNLCLIAVIPLQGTSSKAHLLCAWYLSIPNLGDDASAIENTSQGSVC